MKRHYGSQTNLSTENRTRKLKTTSSTNSLSNNDEPAAKKARLHKRYSSVFSSDTAKRKLKAINTKASCNNNDIIIVIIIIIGSDKRNC